MARALVLANDRLHIGLDAYGLVHDVYFPHVGLESHMPPHGLAHKVGVFVDGGMYWLDDGTWEISVRYHEKAMVGYVVATQKKLGIRLEMTSAVDIKLDVFVRNVHLINTRPKARDITLYCHQALMISDSASSDTAQYRPDIAAIVQYKGNRFFAAHLSDAERVFEDFSIGKYTLDSDSGTYRDADDNQLEKNLVENGRVDSVMSLSYYLEPYDSVRAAYACAVAESLPEVEQVMDELLQNGVDHYLARTASHWRTWIQRAAYPRNTLPHASEQLLDQSLFVIKAHCSGNGAVMASLDGSLRDHPQDDTYAFCWGRDAVYALWPLIRLGYTDEAMRFFNFVSDTLHEEGYVQHKHRADGSLGSTWLPYVHADGLVKPPFQVDETAAVLFLAGQFFRHTNDQGFIVQYFHSVIEPTANFLSGFMHENGLPKSSYDLWEHTYQTDTYATALTYGALLEAAELADAYGRELEAKRWREAAGGMKQAAHLLYNEKKKYFYKGCRIDENGELTFDETLDISSLYGCFMFGLFDTDSPEVKHALVTAQERLSVDGLFMRFEDDSYYQSGDIPNVWLISSLWLCQMLLERDDLDGAKVGIDKVLSLASPSGMLPEQISVQSRQSTGVMPLVWSHAELVNTFIDFVQTQGRQNAS